MLNTPEPVWYNSLTSDQAIAYIEESPFGKDWEGNFLELTALSWCPKTGTLEFSDGRYKSTIQFLPNYSIRYIGDNNPLNMVEAAMAEQRKKQAL
ncbi:hypothetical protein V6C27_03565 [Peptococcaceae bacterium 1198_IL3148]